MMTPIGILTHNRPVYLDATLRSLSATQLPDDVSVTVYDDGSTDGVARKHLDTADVLDVRHRWPVFRAHGIEGLDGLQNHPVLPGIADRVDVVRAAAGSVGVCQASMFAMADLFGRHPDAEGVFLLQDDLVFNADWYQRMLIQAGRVFQRGFQQGLVAGFHLDFFQKVRRTAAVQFCSANCYYVRRGLFELLANSPVPAERKNFDRWVCRTARMNRFEVQLLCPYVCQHIGVESVVRPQLHFAKADIGRCRVGYASHPPYVLADQVRCFRGRHAAA